MSKGGARPRSGPAPDPLALSRKRDGFDALPTTPLDDDDIPDLPDWFVEASHLEIEMWYELWRRPQARVWLADHAINLVVQYVRTYIAAIAPDVPTAKGVLAKQLGEQLLLTPQALFAARYEIRDTDGAPNSALGVEGTQQRARPARASAASVRAAIGETGGIVIPFNAQPIPDDEPWDESQPGDLDGD
jgi:hypothetical protein